MGLIPALAGVGPRNGTVDVGREQTWHRPCRGGGEEIWHSDARPQKSNNDAEIFAFLVRL